MEKIISLFLLIFYYLSLANCNVNKNQQSTVAETTIKISSPVTIVGYDEDLKVSITNEYIFSADTQKRQQLVVEKYSKDETAPVFKNELAEQQISVASFGKNSSLVDHFSLQIYKNGCYVSLLDRRTNWIYLHTKKTSIGEIDAIYSKINKEKSEFSEHVKNFADYYSNLENFLNETIFSKEIIFVAQLCFNSKGRLIKIFLNNITFLN